MKVLITGGAGFIASHLVEELVKRKNEVWILDDLSEGKESNVEGIDYHKHSWQSILEELPKEDFDVVYHLAAKHSVPKSFGNAPIYFRTNIEGTWNILNTYASTSRIVNISSSSAKASISPYGISKKAAELLTDLFSNAVSLRLFNVFGERQMDTGCVIPEFAKNMMRGIPPTIYGTGKQTRDMTYVKDVVNEIIEYGQGMYKSMKGVHDIGYSQQHSVNEVFEKMATLLNFVGEPIYEKPRKGDVMRTQAKFKMNNSKYWFDEGLKRTVKWIEENKPYETKLC